MRMLIDNAWLKERIAADPDLPCEAGVPDDSRPSQVIVSEDPEPPKQDGVPVSPQPSR